ncbi:hypothetical protein GIB67_021051 [Kingdonia uniflora]|uniref:DUF4283 domain-containing protein n=1 Tax=Kingdonia uniflora TaxID=39325 RepID=A0A7J7N775_9MAGN|nr:hypothetical protein GIB67_021051 [Kingdonia uniflora]
MEIQGISVIHLKDSKLTCDCPFVSSISSDSFGTSSLYYDGPISLIVYQFKGGDLLAAALSGLPSMEDRGGSRSDCEGDPLKSLNNQPQTLSKQVADGDECERQNPPSLLEIKLMAMGIHNWDRKKPISEEESRVARFLFDIKFKEADAATKHQFELDFQKFQASQNATSATGASKTKNRHSFFRDSQSNRQLEPEVLIRSEKDQAPQGLKEGRLNLLNSTEDYSIFGTRADEESNFALAEKRNTPMKVLCLFETYNFKSCVLECGNYENKEGRSNCTKIDTEAEWTPNVVTTQTDNELDKGKKSPILALSAEFEEGACSNSKKAAQPTLIKSWASFLSAPVAGRGISKLSFIKPDIVDGKNAIKVGPDEFKENIKTSSLYLVGFFVGKRLAHPFVKETLTKLWDIGGDFEMTIQGLNMFFFKFSNPEDRQKVLEKGDLHIASRVFLIRELRPFIEMETTKFTSIPVWVILRNIPHHMRLIEGMSRIASTLGVPMHLDKFTEEHISTTSFARVCIELHASCEYPSTIPILYGDEEIRDNRDTKPVENVETGDKVTQVNQDDGNPDNHKVGFEETRSSTKKQTRSSSQKQQGLARKNENLLKNKGSEKTLKSSQSSNKKGTTQQKSYYKEKPSVEKYQMSEEELKKSAAKIKLSLNKNSRGEIAGPKARHF